MYPMTREAMYDIFGEVVMAAAEQADWAGDEYSHPQHGVCAAVFYPVHQNEIICRYRPGSDTVLAYGLLNEPCY